MKFIVSFLFSLFLISPTLAAYAPGNSSCNNESSTTCNTTHGCEYSAGLCGSCQSGTYNDGIVSSCQQCCTSQNDNSQNCQAYRGIQNDPTKLHPEGASSCSDWICDTSNGYHIDPNDSNQCTNAQDCSGYSHPAAHYQFDSNCNWYCEADYYKYNDECKACPYGSNTRNLSGVENINSCLCVDGTYKYPDANNWTHCVTYTGHLNSNSTGCATGAQATLSGSSNNWTVTCTCVSPATLSGGQCVCPSNYATTTDGDGVVHCTPCGTGETTQNGNCICDERHYGSHGNCALCPSGTKVATLGTTTTKANCRAYSGTKFCDANGQNCMKLLQ